jgi:hypothetical protein
MMKSAGRTATISASKNRPVGHRDLDQSRIRQFMVIKREAGSILDHLRTMTAVLKE